MFTRLHLENFLSFKGPMDIPLRPLNVVVGPNNSGKSNLLAALRLLSFASKGNAEGVLGRRLDEMFCRNSPRHWFVIGIDAEDSSQQSVPWKSCQYRLTVGGGAFQPLFHGVDKAGRIDEQRRKDNPAIAEEIEKKELQPKFCEYLNGIRFFHFNPSALRAPAQVTPKPSLQEDGKGLAAVVDHLKDEFPDIYDEIQDEFRHCVPEVERIQLRVTANGHKTILLKERGFKESFGAEEISEGLLLFLALLCCIHTQPKPSMILLEEPEHGIHPRRLKDLLELLYSLTESKGDEPPVQILLTTHSPYLLDQFRDDLDALLVLERGEEGTIVKSARQHVDTIHKTGISVGEAWYSGILGGVPA